MAKAIDGTVLAPAIFQQPDARENFLEGIREVAHRLAVESAEYVVIGLSVVRYLL